MSIGAGISSATRTCRTESRKAHAQGGFKFFLKQTDQCGSDFALQFVGEHAQSGRLQPCLPSVPRTRARFGLEIVADGLLDFGLELGIVVNDVPDVSLSSSLTKSRKVSRTGPPWPSGLGFGHGCRPSTIARWPWLPIDGCSLKPAWYFRPINQCACGQQIIHFAAHGKLPIGLICGRCSTRRLVPTCPGIVRAAQAGAIRPPQALLMPLTCLNAGSTASETRVNGRNGHLRHPTSRLSKA